LNTWNLLNLQNSCIETSLRRHSTHKDLPIGTTPQVLGATCRKRKKRIPLVLFFLPSSSIPPLARRTEETSTPLTAPISLTPNTVSISPYTSPGISPPPSKGEDLEDSGVRSEDCQEEAVGNNPETPQGRPSKRRKISAARRLSF
jgi:hypothetical protein